MNTTPGTLQLSSKLPIALYLLDLQSYWGKITDTASLFGVCRDVVYNAYDWAKEAIITNFYEEGFTKEEPITLYKQDRERLIVSLRLRTKASIRGIEDLFEEELGIHISHGAVWNKLHEAAQKAIALNNSVSYEGIKNIATDEIFLKDTPTLTGICLDTGYIPYLRVTGDRSKKAWEKLLTEMKEDFKLYPEKIIKDGGNGMASATNEVYDKSSQHADIFHLYHKCHPHRRFLENAAYRQIQREVELIQVIHKTTTKNKETTTKIEKMSRKISLLWKKWSLKRFHEKKESLLEEKQYLKESKSQLKKKKKQLKEQRIKTAKSIEIYDTFESLYWEMERYLELTPAGIGTLWTSQQVCQGIIEVADKIEALGVSRLHKFSVYLRNRAPEVSLYLDSLNERIDALLKNENPEMISASIRVYQAHLKLNKQGNPVQRKQWKTEAKQANLHLLNTFLTEPSKTKGIFDKVCSILDNRYRASSAIENVHSVLRPYLELQCRVSQDFLDLFQFYWNQRIRKSGKYKGTSAFGLLTGCEPEEDWLTRLGYPHSQTFLSRQQA